MKVVEPTESMLEEAKEKGIITCPECGDDMLYLNLKKINKSEFYCEKCRVSIPLFEH